MANLEAALFWHEVRETQRHADDPSTAEGRVRLRVAGRTRPTAMSLVSANVLTLHPEDEQPDSLIGCNLSRRAPASCDARMRRRFCWHTGSAGSPLLAEVGTALRCLCGGRGTRTWWGPAFGYTRKAGSTCGQGTGDQLEQSSLTGYHSVSGAPTGCSGWTRACAG